MPCDQDIPTLLSRYWKSQSLFLPVCSRESRLPVSTQQYMTHRKLWAPHIYFVKHLTDTTFPPRGKSAGKSKRRRKWASIKAKIISFMFCEFFELKKKKQTSKQKQLPKKPPKNPNQNQQATHRKKSSNKPAATINICDGSVCEIGHSQTKAGLLLLFTVNSKWLI